MSPLLTKLSKNTRLPHQATNVFKRYDLGMIANELVISKSYLRNILSGTAIPSKSLSTAIDKLMDKIVVEEKASA